MKRAAQRFLISTYRMVVRTGALNTAPGRALFDHVYGWYKSLLEVGDVQVLQSFVTPGSSVVDVGANVGFFTKKFARWVTDGGRVVAIEPEEINFRRLTRMISARRLENVVSSVHGVAAQRSGKRRLQINPFHPGDHKIGESGVEVNAYALDEVLAELKVGHVSLIKIDVQGAEAMVLAGAAQTLERFQPSLFIEVDDDRLRAMHSNAKEVFEMLQRRGYRIHRIVKGRLSPPLKAEEARALCLGGRYADFLFAQEQASTVTSGVAAHRHGLSDSEPRSRSPR